MNNNTITLTETVKSLYTTNNGISVKEILGNIQTNHCHLTVDYRKIYNTLKRISGSSSQKPSKAKKTSVILDLSTPPIVTEENN